AYRAIVLPHLYGVLIQLARSDRKRKNRDLTLAIRIIVARCSRSRRRNRAKTVSVSDQKTIVPFGQRNRRREPANWNEAANRIACAGLNDRDRIVAGIGDVQRLPVVTDGNGVWRTARGRRRVWPDINGFDDAIG